MRLATESINTTLISSPSIELEEVDSKPISSYDSSQFISPRMLKSIQSRDFFESLSEDTKKFFKKINLLTNALQKSDIDLTVLKKLYERGYMDRMLRWILFENTTIKMFMLPFLNKQGILDQATLLDIIPKKNRSRIVIPKCVTNRIWPQARSILFQAEEDLRYIYRITAFFDGFETILSGLWPVALYSLIATDFLKGNIGANFTLSTANSLTKLLTQMYLWPVIMTIPFLWGLVHYYHRYDAHEDINEKVSSLLLSLQTYEPGLCNDVFQWLLPLNPMLNILRETRDTLLWDNRIDESERYELRAELIRVSKRASKLTQFAVIQIEGEIVDGVSQNDIIRLSEAGTSMQILHELVFSKTKALAELERLSVYYNDDAANGRIGKHFKPILRYFAAQYKLWSLGYLTTAKWQLGFWLFKAAILYAKLRFFYILVEVFRHTTQEDFKKQSCEANGMVWSHINSINDYICSLCGDLNVFYRDIFTASNCISNFLQRPQKETDLVKLFNRVRAGENITSLDLSRQSLANYSRILTSILPVVKVKFPKLKTLYLNATLSKVDYIGSKIISQFLINSQVQELYLSKQNLSNSTLDIIRILPNVGLLKLDLSENNINGQSIKEFATILPQSNLEELNLRANPISTEGIQVFGPSISKTKLQTLDLSHNIISTAGSAALGSGLFRSNLQVLDLSFTNIGVRGIENLARGLFRSRIEVLRLNACSLDDEGVELLVSNLPHTIKELYLEKNDIGYIGLSEIASQMSNSGLRTLALGYNTISVRGARSLSFLLTWSRLQVLDLRHCQITDEVIGVLSNALSISSLRELYLSDNPITASGAAALAKSLPRTIQILDLARNNIGDKGATALASQLQILRILRLNSNKITVNGTSVLAKYLSSSRIQGLDLSSNLIGINGAKVLVGLLPKSNLISLNLCNNSIHTPGLQNITFKLQHSPLQALDLSYNQIEMVGIQSLISELPHSNLTTLKLFANKINTDAAKALCHVLPSSKVKLDSSTLGENLINPKVLDYQTCVTSSASKLQLPLPFQLLSQIYSFVSGSIYNLYNKLNTENLFQFSVSWPKMNSMFGFSATKNSIQIHSSQHLLPMSAKEKITENDNGNTSYPHPLPSSFHPPQLSFTEKLIVFQFIFYYFMKLINIFSEYNLFTFFWNRPRDLSPNEEVYLNKQLKKLQAFQAIIISQKASRTGKNLLFQDKFQFFDRHLVEMQNNIETALAVKKIASTELSAIEEVLDRIEQMIHQLAYANKQLKYYNVKVRRKLSHTNHHHQPIVVTAKHDPITGLYSETIFDLSACSDSSKFSTLQLFWNKLKPQSVAPHSGFEALTNPLEEERSSRMSYLGQ